LFRAQSWARRFGRLRVHGALDAGVQHAFLLIPTDENGSAESATAAPNKSATEKRNIRDFCFPGGRTPKD
jgi:hypothetical protein